MKLYHRYSRFAYRRLRNRRQMEHCCTGFNTVVKEVQPTAVWSRRGWAIIDVDFDIDPGGSCSLIHCGVKSPVARDLLETNWLTKFQDPKYIATLKRWYGSDFEQRSMHLFERARLLAEGDHFLDERGVPLGKAGL